MRQGKVHLVTAATMPDCVATAAFAASALGFSFTLGPHTRSLTLENVEGDTGRTLFVVGTFWKDQILEWSKRFAYVHVYSFGDDISDMFAAIPNVNCFCDRERKGSIAWLQSQRWEQSIQVDADLLSLLNVRWSGEGDDRVQAFFTGVYDYVTTLDVDMMTVFMRLLDGSMLKVEDVITRGNLLLANHRGICAERVRKSALVTPRVVMVEGPEFINHTHAAIVKAHPRIGYSVVYRILFNKGEPILAVSVRTYPEFASDDALVFLHGLGSPGGSAKAAGTTGPFAELWEKLLKRIAVANE